MRFYGYQVQDRCDGGIKKKGYTSNRIRDEKLMGQSYLQQLRHGELVSWKAIDVICKLLECQPGDLLEYVKD